MSGTVTSAELKTRVLISLPDGCGCAACTTATEIQDKIRRRLIRVFIHVPLYSKFENLRAETRSFFFSLRFTTIPRASAEQFEFKSTLPHTKPMTLNLCRAQGLLSLLID
jgi:hypothetical protein